MVIKNKVIDLAQQYSKLIADLREQIHQYPETGFELPKTTKLVLEHLHKLNLFVKSEVNISGIYADLMVPNATKTIAIRADMDALEIQENNSKCLYSSKVGGKGHMCGHDGHTAMLLGAAYILNDLRDFLKVNVRFIFQPSEEVIPGGALGMIKEGVLENVSEIYGLHVAPFFAEGKIGIWKEYAFSGNAQYQIRFNGKGGHSSLPQLSINPLHMASSFILQSEHILGSNLDTFDQAVITTTMFHAGSAPNIIPGEATICGSVRYLKPDVLEKIFCRMEEVAKGSACSYGGSYQIDFKKGYPAVRNSQQPVQNVQYAAEELFGVENVLLPERPIMASEDFSYYAEKIPACFYGFGIANPAKGFVSGLHEPSLDFDSNILWKGAALHALIALSQT